MARYAHSQFNTLIPLNGGRTLAYNGYSGATAVWQKEERQQFDCIDSCDADDHDVCVRQLRYGGYIVPAEIDEIALLKQEYDSFRYDPSSLVFTVAPTLACNFGCDYCFQGQHKPSSKMSVAVQDALIQFISRLASVSPKKGVSIAWYGGEPLLAKDIITALSKRLISLCREYRMNYSAMMVSNGYGLTLDVARSLFQDGVQSVQVTIDGAHADHDTRRSLLGGQPTFEKIVRNITEVTKNTQMRLSIRVNVDARNAQNVWRLIDSLRESGLGHQRNFSLYFAPVEAVTQGCHDVADKCMSKTAYGQLESSLAQYAFDAGLCSLPYPRRFTGVCGAVRPNSYVVAPSGDLHKCWDTISDPKFKVGTLFDTCESGMSRAVEERWLGWTPFENATCSACRILPNCAGSCAHKFVNPEETLGEAAALPCPSLRFNINEQLIARAERSGAISRDDYSLEMVRTDPMKICSATTSIRPSTLHDAAVFVPLIALTSPSKAGSLL
jgi:uncharacterized protein